SYDWYAVADDGVFSEQSATWSFTTLNNAPNAPTNPSPADGAENISTDPTLEVDVSDPDGDEMTVTFYDASDDGQIDQNTGVTNGTTSVTWNDLSTGTTYDWYAVADDGTNTTRSSTWSFTTLNNAPAAPKDPSPADGAENVITDPTLEVDVSDPDGDEMTVTFYDASDDSQIGENTGVTNGTTSVTWSGLSYNTTYQWYAVADDGQATNQSSTWSFTTTTEFNTAPDEPTNPSPADGATGVSTNTSLSVDVSDPDGDSIDVSFYWNDGTHIETVSGVSSGSTVTTSTLSLNSGTTYQWYAVADDGQATNQSDTWSFTTNYAPDVPTNPSPADGATGVSTDPTLSVDVSDPDGDSMDVSFYNASDDSLINTDSGVADGGTASVTWSDLSYNTTYDWYAVADDGQATNSSGTWSFTTIDEINRAPDAPTDPSPQDGAADVTLNPTLSVNVSDPDEDSMDVVFYDASNDSSIGLDTNVNSGGRASVTWSNLSDDTIYEWYAVASDGSLTNQSETWSFTTSSSNKPPESPTNPSPSNGTTDVGLSPTLFVDVSDPDGDPMDVVFYDASDDGEIGTDIAVPSGSSASVTWSGLAENTTYEWYAVADDGLLTNHSSVWSFTTLSKNNAPDAPKDPSPSNGETGVSTDLTLSVNVSDPDGDPMDIIFYDAFDGSTIGLDTGVKSGERASVNWSDLSKGNTYEWYAIASDGSQTTRSENWEFTTSMGNRAPESPADPSPSDGETGVNTDLTLSVNVSDPDGDPIDVSFYDASDDSEIGTDVDVQSGETASVGWDGLAENSSYEWYAVADDGSLTNRSAMWSFTTVSEENNVPYAPTDPSPEDGTIDVGTSPTLSVNVSDPDNDMMDITFYDASNDTEIGKDIGVASGGTASVTWSDLTDETTYEWYAVAYDGRAKNRSETWSFTTGQESNTAPDEPTDPSPEDGATGMETSPTLSVNVSDPDGDTLEVMFYEASDDTEIDTNTDVASGERASITWSDLTKNKTYEWYVEVDDGTSTTRSETWSFTTTGEDTEKLEAVAEANRTEISPGDTVYFDGSDSSGEIVSYTWTIEGENHTEMTIDHRFEQVGTYEVTLTVEDAAGNSDADTLTVTVEEEEDEKDDDESDGSSDWLLYLLPLLIAIILVAGLLHLKSKSPESIEEGTEEGPVVEEEEKEPEEEKEE
ncbi:MAG: PKD domain-containing protein, partial [Candidatus Thermoplasmatota archaeon]|nr:PKD domain-containing protein [Candidatus Thermoplasmatota archaeon]